MSASRSKPDVATSLRDDSSTTSPSQWTENRPRRALILVVRPDTTVIGNSNPLAPWIVMMRTA